MNRVRIAEAGGVETIIAALRDYPKEKVMQESGCEALTNLARNDTNCVRIAEIGGVEVIIAALRAYLDRKFVRKA